MFVVRMKSTEFCVLFNHRDRHFFFKLRNRNLGGVLSQQCRDHLGQEMNTFATYPPTCLTELL